MSHLDSSDIRIAAYWLRSDSVTAGQFLDRALAYLDRLKNVSSLFSQPLLVDSETEMSPLPHGRAARFGALLPRLEVADTWYVAKDGSRQVGISADACCEIGFYLSFFFDHGRAASTVSILDGQQIGGPSKPLQGGDPMPSSVVVDGPSEHLDSPQLLERLLSETVSHWEPDVSWVLDRAFYDAVSGDEDAVIGWLTYFADPDFVAALPADVAWKRVETGGVLIALDGPLGSDERLDQAIRIRETLASGGKLEW